MFKRRLVPSLLLAALSLTARAEIYECVDQNGNKRFTNIREEAKGCKVLNVGPVAPPTPAPASGPATASSGPKSPAKPGAIATPANFPRVDRETQQSRDSERRRILERELGAEQQLLDQARKELSEQESVRLGTERNYQRVLDRLEPFKKKVKLHEDNVANIKREIGNIR